MTVEVRPPTRAEMPGYYRVLPYVNGLPMWEPANAAWHGGSEPWPPPRMPATAEQLELWAASDVEDQTFHPVGAFVEGECVGASATLSFQVTMPGGTTMSMAGVTATGVIATHRRQGHLRRMMQVMFDGALERGEPLAMLSASEGSIYGRYGFAPATYRARWEIARQDAAFLPAAEDTGTLHLIAAAEAREHWPALHAQVRGGRVGELTARPERWERLTDAVDGTNGPLRYLMHRGADGRVDGLANYRLPWSSTEENAGTLVVEAFEALTPEAYRAMWQLLLDFDLTRTVVAPGRARQEPLTWMLRNPRALRITRQSDNLWARILDVPQALAGRGYDTADSIVLRVDEDEMCPRNVGTWKLTTHGAVPRCVASEHEPDATLSIQALSSLLFGGVSAHDLAFAGHITAPGAGVLGRISRLFSIDPAPHNSFGF